MNKIKITPQQRDQYLSKYGGNLPANLEVIEPEAPPKPSETLTQAKATATMKLANKQPLSSADSVYVKDQLPEAPKARSYTEARGQYDKQITDAQDKLNKNVSKVDAEGIETDRKVQAYPNPAQRTALKNTVSTYSDSLASADRLERMGVPNMDNGIQLLGQYQNALNEFSKAITMYRKQGMQPQQAVDAAKQWFQQQNGATIDEVENMVRTIKGQ